MISVCRTNLAVLCVLACARTVVPGPLEHSVSTSRQFLVYGPEIRLRGAICDLAERTKGDVLRLIDQRDDWITPIVVNARHPRANLPEEPRAALNFAQTGFGLKLQLDLTVVSDVRQPEVRRELLRVILLEMMYRRQTDLPVGAAYVPPPDWLLDGIAPRQSDFDREKLFDILKLPVAARGFPPLEAFLRQRSGQFDVLGRSLHRAYSYALVEFLLDRPGGRHCLARCIADLSAVSNDGIAGLGKYFPELSNSNDAEKKWRLHLEQLASGQPLQLLSAQETEQKLDELLFGRIGDADPKRKYHLDEFQRFIRDPSSKSVLTQFSADLEAFATRANPIYCPLIYEYEKTARRLARGKTSGITERLAGLNAARKGIAAQARKIDDYMNWFEATKPEGPSRAFSDYLRAAEMTSQPEKRRDPISVYLDVLETQFQN